MKNILPDRCSAFIACHHSRFMKASRQNFFSFLNGGEIMAFSWEVSTVRFWEQLSLMELLLSFYAFKPTALCSAAVLRCCSTAASLAIDKARPETCKKPQNLGGHWLHCAVMHLAGVSRITLMFGDQLRRGAVLTGSLSCHWFSHVRSSRFLTHVWFCPCHSQIVSSLISKKWNGKLHTILLVRPHPLISALTPRPDEHLPSGCCWIISWKLFHQYQYH